MFLLPLILTTFAAAPPAKPTPPPSTEQVKQTVERSLVFLEKSGSAWWNGSKCASCHHVPITIWGLTEARKRGFAVNEKALEKLQSSALTSYTTHPKLTPVGQDGNGAGLSLNTIYLSLAATSATSPDENAKAALKKFTAHLLAKQEADGSWKAGGGLPPVEDTSEVRTMQAVLVLASAEEKGLVEGDGSKARERALAWLRKTKVGENNQSLVMRVLVSKRFGTAEEMAELVKRLLAQQNSDGGWQQAKNRPSDALATGQSLYALSAAGVEVKSPAMQQARAFLTGTQTKDGSWRVPIRSQKNSGTALSHYGSGWAALGLMQTLSEAKYAEK